MSKILSYFNFLVGRDRYVDNSILTESMKTDFISFQKQQAIRIRSHINYDNDLSGANPVNSDVIIKFDSKAYIKEINKYFVEKDFYNHTTESNFHIIILNILVPDSEIQDIIPINIRKEIFIGVLNNISMQSNIELKNIIKFYWEYISVLKKIINGHNPESVLVIYKECISGIKESDYKIKDGLNNLQKINIVSDYLISIGLKRGKDLVKLYRKSNYISFWFGTIGIILIFMAAMSKISMEIFSIIFNNLELAVNSNSLKLPLIVTFCALMIFRIPPFVRNSTKRKIMVSTMNLFESSLNITSDTMRVFFKNKYSFEYKKMKRW